MLGPCNPPGGAESFVGTLMVHTTSFVLMIHTWQ